MGRDDKRIPTRLAWGREGVTELLTGWICERVNVTQWGESLGEISAYSCWCEVAMMLTWCDIPGIYWNLGDDHVFALDHLCSEILETENGKKLHIHNPTPFDARVKILAETQADRAQNLPLNCGATFPTVCIPAGQYID
jgi:hypothetical protein